MTEAYLYKLDLTDRHPFYVAWCRLRQRCDNPNATQYPYYGGRGVTYSTEWREFINFYNDMWADWRPNLSLDRIDVNGNYCVENCRWATWEQQASNKRPYKLDTRNFSGVKGVSWVASRKKWLAQGFVNGKRIHLYIGPDLQIAYEARKQWEAENVKKF